MSKERTLDEYRQVKTYGYKSPQVNSLTAEDFLDECNYVSQDGDTVFIDEQELIKCMEQYAIYHTSQSTPPTKFKKTK